MMPSHPEFDWSTASVSERKPSGPGAIPAAQSEGGFDWGSAALTERSVDPFQKGADDVVSEAKTGSILEDFARHAASGFVQGIAGDVKVIDYATGGTKATEYAGQKLQETTQGLQEGMSEAQREADRKEFFSEDEEGNYSLGEAWSDPLSYMGVAASGIGSLGGMILTGGPLKWLAKKGLTKAIGKNVKDLTERGVAKNLAENEVFKRMRLIDNLSGVIGYGAAEGAMVAGNTGQAIEMEVMDMPEDVITKAPIYKETLGQLSEALPNLPSRRVKKLARQQVARQLGMEGARDVAAPAVLLGSVAGHWINKALTGRLAKSRVAGLGKAALVETPTEGTQGATEQLIQNLKVQEVDPSRRPGAGVLESGFREGLGGLAAGGAIGVAAKPEKAAKKVAEPPTEQQPPTEPPPPEAPPSAEQIAQAKIDAQFAEQARQDRADAEIAGTPTEAELAPDYFKPTPEEAAAGATKIRERIDIAGPAPERAEKPVKRPSAKGVEVKESEMGEQITMEGPAPTDVEAPETTPYGRPTAKGIEVKPIEEPRPGPEGIDVKQITPEDITLQDVKAKNGKPFKKEGTAKVARKIQKLTNYKPVEVEGGWVLRKEGKPAVTTKKEVAAQEAAKPPKLKTTEGQPKEAAVAKGSKKKSKVANLSEKIDQKVKEIFRKKGYDLSENQDSPDGADFYGPDGRSVGIDELPKDLHDTFVATSIVRGLPEQKTPIKPKGDSLLRFVENLISRMDKSKKGEEALPPKKVVSITKAKDNRILEKIAEIAAEAGYPVTDEAGRPDTNRLRTLMNAAASGTQTYANPQKPPVTDKKVEKAALPSAETVTTEAPAPAFTATTNEVGALQVTGDKEAIRTALKEAGIKGKGLPRKGGLLFGRSQARVVREALGLPKVVKEPAKKVAVKIDDLGEKVGGARKDTAEATGPRKVKKLGKKVPTWRKRYEVSQVVKSSRVDEEGRWVIFDSRKTDWQGQPRKIGDSFATKEEADQAVPLVAVAEKHHVRSASGRKGEPIKYEIWRKIGTRKIVMAVNQQFETREDAMRYMAQNAEEILETKLSFGEEVLPTPEKVYRTGPERRKKNVEGKDFMETFGFRGVEFGLWNNQDERQEVMNHSYDALLDLAEIINVPPQALSLNGDLALAFGARGQGLSGAKAHYERNYGIINLTKMKGAGSLAHEWLHALDHYIARLDGSVSSEKVKNARGDLVYKPSKKGSGFASEGFLYDSKTRKEVQEAYKDLIQTMFKKAETYVEDTQKAERFVGKARDELARQLDRIRKALADQLDPTYWKRNNKPASSEQLARFDELSEQMVNGESLELESRKNIGGKARFPTIRMSNDVLDEMAGIYKSVRGRSGFRANREGGFDRLSGYISIYQARIQMLKDASGEITKTRKVPTSYYMQAKGADQAKSGEYWSSPHEMAARAFAAYVEDMLAKKAAGNDFLAYHAHGAVFVPIYPEGFFRPYPEGTEREAVNAAFDKFFKVLQTKETSKGTALYSRTEAQPSAGLSTSQARQSLADRFGEKAISKLENDGILTIVRTASGLPAHLRDEPGTIKGVYDPTTGKAYIVAENVSQGEETGIFLHEISEHYGMERMLGKTKYKQLLNQVNFMLKTNRDAIVEARAKVPAKTQEDNITQETLAYYLQNSANEKAPLYKRVIAAVRAWLFRTFGGRFVKNLTTEDLKALAISAIRVATRGPKTITGALQPAYSAVATAGAKIDEVAAAAKEWAEKGVKSKYFQKWFKGSNVTDEKGEPLILYHGTAFDYDAFKHSTRERTFGQRRDTSKIVWFTDNQEAAGHYARMSATKKKGDDPITALAWLWNKEAHRSVLIPSGRMKAAGGENVIPAYISGKLRKIEVKEGFNVNFTAKERREAIQDTIREAKGEGYDGVLFEQLSDLGILQGVMVATFPSAEIKSTMNRGTFDPADPRISYSIQGQALFSRGESISYDSPEQEAFMGKIAPTASKVPIRERLKEVRQSVGLKIRQGVVDQYASIFNLSEEAGMLAALTHSASGALESSFVNGAPRLTDDGAITVDTTGKGLAHVLRPLSDELDRFMGWIAANRANDLMKQGRERNFTEDEIKGGMTLNRGKMDDGKSRVLVYAKVHQEFKAFQKAILDIAEQTGLINAEERATWNEDFYVPFYRLLEQEGDARGPTTLSRLSNQTAYKKLKGAPIPLNDLLQNTLMNWNHLLQASLRNQATEATLQAAQKIGVASEVSEKEKGKTSIFVRRDGRQVWYDIEDPLLVEALSALNWEGFNNPAMKAMRKFKRAFTMGITASPEFRIANLLRDTVHAVAVGDISYNMVGNVIAGTKATRKDSLTRARMLAGGGEMHFGHLYGADPDSAKLLIKKGITENTIISGGLKGANKLKQGLKGAWDWWQETGSRIENINRAALYEQRIEEVGDLRANFEARDLMNFSRHGAWPAVRFLIQVIPFANARLQGLDKMGRAIADPKQRKQFAVTTSMVALASMALYLAFKDDEDYKQREEWDRDTYWWFKLPGSEIAYRIPKPFEVGSIGTMAERLLEQVVDDKAHGELFAERLGFMIKETFAFNMVPQMFRPILDVYSNYDPFTGRTIESMSMERLSPAERKRAWTSQTAILFSQGMDKVSWGKVVLSPVQVEYMVRGYLGWVGSTALASVDTLTRPAVGAATRPAMRIDQYPVIKRFVRESPARNSKYTTIFYEQLKEMNQLHADAQAYRKARDFEKADKIVKDNLGVLKLRKRYNAMRQELSKINTRIKFIYANRKYSAEEKRTRIDRLTQIKNMLTKRLVENNPQ